MSRFAQYFSEAAKNPVLDVESENLAVTVESAVNDVLLAEAAVADEHSIVADMEEIATSLESLAETAEASIADGGLDRVAGALLQQAADAHTTRLGFQASITPSQESFGGSGERVHNTQVAVESIKDTAKDVWEAIVKAIKAAMIKIKEWWNKLTNALPGIKKRAEALKEKAENVEGSIKEKKISVGGDANRVMVGESAEGLVKNLENLKTIATGVAKSATSDHADAIEKLADKADDFESDKITDDATLNAFGKDLEDAFNTVAKAVAKQGFTTNTGYWDKKDGITYLTTDEVMGGKMGLVAYKASPANTGETFSNFQAAMVNSAKTPKDISSKDIATLDKSDVVKACEVIVEICDVLEDFSKNYNKIETAKQKIIGAGDKLVSKVGKEKDVSSQAKKAAGWARSALNKAGTTADQPGVGYVGNAATAMKASLNICEKSLAQYKKD